MANIVRRTQQGNLGTLPSLLNDWDPFRVLDTLMRWDPYQEAVQTRRQEPVGVTGFVPRFDVKETKDSYNFKADLPGVKEEDVEISLTGNRLTISGKRDIEEREDNDNYFMIERQHGSFTRSFTLPDSADVEHIKAELKNGTLTVVLPKRPEAQPRRISVNRGPGAGNGGDVNVNRNKA
jgi:HSP20 family protein